MTLAEVSSQPLIKALNWEEEGGTSPHITFTSKYIKCRDVNGASRAGIAVTSVHPSIYSYTHLPTICSFIPSHVLSLSLSFCLSLSLSFPMGAGVSMLAQTMEEDTPDDFTSEHGASLSMESFTQKSLVSSPEVVTILFLSPPLALTVCPHHGTLQPAKMASAL